MASERVRRDSFLSDLLSSPVRQRSHSTSGHLNPTFLSSEETLPEEQHLSDDGNISSNAGVRSRILHSRVPATIHAIRPGRMTFLDEFFSLPPIPPPATIHALRPERRTRLDELHLSEISRLRSLSRHMSVSLPPASPLVSERMIRMQVLEQYLNERGADLFAPASVPTSSFFRLAFHNHLIDELKKMSPTSENHWLYWYMHILFKYTGLKHIALTMLLVCYTLVGGFIFTNLEYSSERTMTLSKGAGVISEISAIAASLNQSAFAHVNLTAQMTEFYLRVVSTDGFTSSLDRMHDDNATWTFGAGTFYAMTLLSTIGYGTIACQTTWGKAVTVIYVTIGLPLMLIVLRDLGFVIFMALQKAYNRFHASRQMPTAKRSKEDMAMAFPLPLALLLVYIYLMAMTLIIFFFDEEEADVGSSGLSFGNCFYFAFISLTTIGLGDVMPRNIHYSPIFAGVFLSGLALISTVNTATYARIERKYFNAMNALEHVLLELEVEEDKKKEQHDGEEQQRQPKQRVVGRLPVFHELMNVVRLAALVIPNLDNKLDDIIAKSCEALNDTNSRKVSVNSSENASSNSEPVTALHRNGWTSLRNSVRSKYKALQAMLSGSISQSAPELTSDASRPSISIVVDRASPELLEQQERDKRFTVCPVQDR